MSRYLLTSWGVRGAKPPGRFSQPRRGPGAGCALPALALLAFTLPAFAGGDTGARPAVDSKHVSCLDGELARGPAIVRGAFRRGGESTRLFLSGGERGCRLRHEGGGRPGEIETDSASFAAICHDAATGRDRAVLHHSSGQYHQVEVWAVDPATGNPERLYDEGWGDDAPTERGAEWGITGTLVGADGACLWRARSRARQTVKAALSALRVGKGAVPGDGEPGATFVPPTRAVSAETARRWLTALERLATAEGADGVVALEGAIYADAAARASWRVVQVLGLTLCDAEGAVLLLDRRRGTWRTIYDVPTGCSKMVNFPMRGMVVRGDRLFVALCVSCAYWGDYRDFSIDLRDGRATLLGWGTERLDKENPPILDVDREVFSE